MLVGCCSLRARTFSCWAVSLVCLQRHIFVVCTMDVMDLEPQEVAPKFVAVVVPEDGQGEPYEVTLPTDCHLYTSAYHIPPPTNNGGQRINSMLNTLSS